MEMVTNRRPVDEFEKKEAGFVEWVKLHHPEDLENVIDKRMKKTIDVVSEATEVIKFGLICADLTSGRHLSWDKIWDLLSSISCTGDRGRDKGHKHVHHRGDN